jgi:hypothetical protein
MSWLLTPKNERRKANKKRDLKLKYPGLFDLLICLIFAEIYVFNTIVQ